VKHEDLEQMNAEIWVGGVAVWLGVVFIAAGSLKLARPYGLRDVLVRRLAIRQERAMWLATALAIGEASLGVLLAIGMWPAFTAAVLGLLLVVFTGFLMTGSSKADAACACFGLLDADTNGRFVGVGRNVVLLSAATIVAFTADPVQGYAFLKWSTTSVLLGGYLFVISAVIYILIRQFAEPLTAE
jgi:uncharacterized membrane protein YphA (DoxX/SURF4 family)